MIDVPHVFTSNVLHEPGNAIRVQWGDQQVDMVGYEYIGVNMTFTRRRRVFKYS